MLPSCSPGAEGGGAGQVARCRGEEQLWHMRIASCRDRQTATMMPSLSKKELVKLEEWRKESDLDYHA